jgi:hypothetical protein
MHIKASNFHNYLNQDKTIKSDLIGDLGDETMYDFDTTQYLYYIVEHPAAKIYQKFTDIEEARLFSLAFDLKNKNNETYNIDNILGVKEELANQDESV